MASFRARHASLAQALGNLSLLVSAGQLQRRNYAGNPYPFRASSHFIYLAGQRGPGAYFLLHQHHAHLFLPETTMDDLIWSGPGEEWGPIADLTGCQLHPLAQLATFIAEIDPQNLAVIPHPDLRSNQVLAELVGRYPSLEDERDRLGAQALLNLRLYADADAQSELQMACDLTVEAHLAALNALPRAQSESDIAAAMARVITQAGGTFSFIPIITTCGERLHQVRLGNLLQADRLLLVDVGAETASGWGGDVTNTWPVSGRYSSSQALIYNLVLDVHRQVRAELRPGLEYKALHSMAHKLFTEGLAQLGILRGGTVEEYLEQNVASLFFPHGIGHLLGLDPHDMEDLGDLAGYAPGRRRDPRFGWSSLRLDRQLDEGMVVTVEPGLYFIPELWEAPQFKELAHKYLDRERLQEFSDVHGVRIERDYLITPVGHELLTPDMPTTVEEIEKYIAERKG